MSEPDDTPTLPPWSYAHQMGVWHELEQARAEVSRLREALKRKDEQLENNGLALDERAQLTAAMDRAVAAEEMLDARDEDILRWANQVDQLSAEVSRLQQENALFRRSLDMLTKQLDEKDSEIVELKDAVYRLCPPRS